MTMTVCACAAFAGDADIALLHGRDSNGTDFDAARKKLNYAADYYKCNDADIKKFCANISKYRLVMVDSLFNFRNKTEKLISDDATDFRAINRYIKDGGVLVVADVCYFQVRDWVTAIAPEFKLPEIGQCNSSQWAVLGHTHNVEPIDPIRAFPNTITQANDWPHFEKEVPKGWKILSECSEGFPITLSRPYGKGMIIVSALRQQSVKLFENYYAAAQLLRGGVNVKNFSMTPFQLGPGKVEIELQGKAPSGTELVYSLKDAQGRETAFSTNFVGAVASLDYMIKVRGKLYSRMILRTPNGDLQLFGREGDMPQLLTVDAPEYRGILSTQRRTPGVDFRVRLAPVDENIRGAKLTMKIFDSNSNCVYTAERVLPKEKDEELPLDFYFNVELPKSLTAGGYEVRATLDRYRAHSEAPFEIIAPRTAQCVVDEDKTFLVAGKPFFPLGIYHPAGAYEEISGLGFNMIQFWKWDMGDDGYGSPTGPNRALASGLRLLFESNHFGEPVYRQVTSKLADHDAMLMYYVSDEPAEGAEDRVKYINDCWHKLDKQHPTYLLSCREDLFGLHSTFGDVFAFDVYGGGSDDVWAPMPQTARWMATAAAATRNKKALVVVPWSNPKDPSIIRPIAYTALANDARGIIWYPWKQAGGGPIGIGLNSDEKCKEVYKTLLPEIKGLFPGLLSTKRRTFRAMDDRICAMVCGTDNGKRFLIMTNPTGETIEVDFQVEELAKVKTVKTYPDDKDVTLDGGNVKCTFEPHGVLVYRW